MNKQFVVVLNTDTTAILCSYTLKVNRNGQLAVYLPFEIKKKRNRCPLKRQSVHGGFIFFPFPTFLHSHCNWQNATLIYKIVEDTLFKYIFWHLFIWHSLYCLFHGEYTCSQTKTKQPSNRPINLLIWSYPHVIIDIDMLTIRTIWR